MSTQPRTLAIVGGSLGGLLQGVALSSLGHSVTIFERSSSLSDQGAGIVLGENMRAFFQRFDATKTDLAVPANGGRQYLGRESEVIKAEKAWVQEMTSWAKLYWILRANFDGKEKEGFAYGLGPRPRPSPTAAYRLGANVTDFSFSPSTGKVSVTYTPSSSSDKPETFEADLLIAADGASSSIRKKLVPEAKRTNVGYLAFRGLVPERELSPCAAETLSEKFTFFHAAHTQFLCYLIPGPNGAIESGKRNLNWVWYNNYAEGSPELDRVMTDKHGTKRTVSVPLGLLKPEVVDTDIRQRAERVLPDVLKEVVRKTRDPFLQVVTDVRSPQAMFDSGKALLVGDAVCGARPHTARSTNQAALHALLLHDYLQQRQPDFDLDNLSEGWELHVLDYARELAESGKRMGDLSQFGEHPLSVDSSPAGAKEVEGWKVA